MPHVKVTLGASQLAPAKACRRQYGYANSNAQAASVAPPRLAALRMASSHQLSDTQVTVEHLRNSEATGCRARLPRPMRPLTPKQMSRSNRGSVAVGPRRRMPIGLLTLALQVQLYTFAGGALGATLSCASVRGSSSREAGAGDDSSAVDPPVRPLGIRLIFVADLEGSLEPCGCAGQPGAGIDHLAAALLSAREPARPSLVIAFDQLFAPDAEERRGRVQDSLSAQLLADLLPRMGVSVAVPARADRLGAQAQLLALRRAGVSLLAPPEPGLDEPNAPMARSELRDVGAVRVGLIGASDTDDMPGLQAEIERLRNAGAQLTLVVLTDERQRRAFDSTGAAAPDLIVVADKQGAAAPTASRTGSTTWLRVPTHSQGLLVADIQAATPDSVWGSPSVRASRLPLSAESARDPFVRSELNALFERINRHNAGHAGQPDSSTAGGSRFVGSDTCAACHTAAYLWWRGTPHARAFTTLQARHRQLDLDCIGCHVTGYQQPGGATASEHAHLEGVGCESCHGPGSAHADNPGPSGSISRAVAEPVCTRCHDAQRGDGFAYSRARGRLLTTAHGGI